MQRRGQIRKIGLMNSEVRKLLQAKHCFLTITMILLQFLIVVSL
jgi:hypothetical protein